MKKQLSLLIAIWLHFGVHAQNEGIFYTDIEPDTTVSFNNNNHYYRIYMDYDSISDVNFHVERYSTGFHGAFSGRTQADWKMVILEDDFEGPLSECEGWVRSVCLPTSRDPNPRKIRMGTRRTDENGDHFYG